MDANQLHRLEERCAALEAEARAIRGAIASALRCTCPVGFGSEQDPNYPRHRAAAAEAAA